MRHLYYLSIWVTAINYMYMPATADSSGVAYLTTHMQCSLLLYGCTVGLCHGLSDGYCSCVRAV